MSTTIELLLAYCVKGGRVCPTPIKWNDLWEMLPNRRRSNIGWEPPLPLVLGAWWHTSDQEKRERLIEHIQWADRHGALDRVDAFLRGLPEHEWHCTV